MESFKIKVFWIDQQLKGELVYNRHSLQLVMSQPANGQPTARLYKRPHPVCATENFMHIISSPAAQTTRVVSAQIVQAAGHPLTINRLCFRASSFYFPAPLSFPVFIAGTL